MSTKFVLDDKLYKTIKWAVQIVLPSLATFYYGVSEIWNLPYSYEIPATITALCAMLGVVLGISSSQYYGDESNYDGVMRVNKGTDGQLYDLVLNGDPLDLAVKENIRFKVDQAPSEKRM